MMMSASSFSFPISSRCSTFFVVAAMFMIVLGAAASLSSSVDAFPEGLHEYSFRAAFGSCMNSKYNQSTLWPTLLRSAAHQHHRDSPLIDLFLGLGDWIYADSMPLPLLPYFTPGTVEHMQALFHKQDSLPEFASFRKQLTRGLIGVLSDHDGAGVNDGTRHDLPPSRRKAVQHMFLNFLGVNTSEQDAEAFHRRSKRDGHYAFHKVPIGSTSISSSPSYDASPFAACFVLLDWRFHRDPPRGDSTSGSVLGEAQWRWLEEVIKNEQDPDFPAAPSSSAAECAVIFLASETPILDDVPLPMEGLGEYRDERDRLFRVLARHARRGIVLLSGDIHMALVSRMQNVPFRFQSDVFEITSSGLTHSLPTFIDQQFAANWLGPASPRRQFLRAVKNFGTIAIDCARKSMAATTTTTTAACQIRVAVHDAESGDVLAVVEPRFFAEERQHSDAEINLFTVPQFDSWLTLAVMWIKVHVPFFYYRPRMTAVFFLVYVALTCAGALIWLLVRAALRWRKAKKE